MNARLTTVLAGGHEIGGSVGGKEKDVAARQNRPHVFLIGRKHTTNPSASRSFSAPPMRGCGLVGRVSNIYSFFSDAGVRICISGSDALF